jgi:ABC-2 type transport system permease protein
MKGVGLGGPGEMWSAEMSGDRGADTKGRPVTGALSSEWLKLRSVRSTWYVLGAVAVTVPLAAFLAKQGVDGWDSLPQTRRVRFQGPAMEQALLPLVQLCMAVLAVLAITSEYATGMIRTSLTAVPRRGALLAAKAAVVAAISLVAGQLAVWGMFLVCRAIVGDRLIPPGYTTAVSEEIPMVLASGLSVVVIALVALGLGTVMRSTAGAIVAVCVLLFMMPLAVNLLADPWNDRIASVLPSNLAAQLVAHPSAVGSLPPLAALAVLLAYGAVALGAGAVVLAGGDT